MPVTNPCASHQARSHTALDGLLAQRLFGVEFRGVYSKNLGVFQDPSEVSLSDAISGESIPGTNPARNG